MIVRLVPKLQLGNVGTEAPASRASSITASIYTFDEAGASRQRGSQAGAWEPAGWGAWRLAGIGAWERSDHRNAYFRSHSMVLYRVLKASSRAGAMGLRRIISASSVAGSNQ